MRIVRYNVLRYEIVKYGIIHSFFHFSILLWFTDSGFTVCMRFFLFSFSALICIMHYMEFVWILVHETNTYNGISSIECECEPAELLHEYREVKWLSIGLEWLLREHEQHECSGIKRKNVIEGHMKNFFDVAVDIKEKDTWSDCSFLLHMILSFLLNVLNISFLVQ